MKRLLIALALAAFSLSAVAGDVHVKGYTKKDGTYVAPYTRSAPNARRSDNKNSQSNGGTQRDEYSSRPATNKTNSSYRYTDNDGDGQANAYDAEPEDSGNDD